MKLFIISWLIPSFIQYPVVTTLDLDDDLPELQKIPSNNPNRAKVSQTNKTTNPRRPLTRQKKRNNSLRRQRISNRKTSTQLRQMKQPLKTVKEINDRFATEIKTTPIDQVC